MDRPLLALELLLGALLLLVVAWLAFSWWRRVRIAGGHGTALGVVRTDDVERTSIVRMGPRALELHSLWGAGTTPYLALRRTTVEIEWLDEAPGSAGRWVRLTGSPVDRGPGGTHDHATVEVALSSGDGRALRAWQETLPPGHAFGAGL